MRRSRLQSHTPLVSKTRLARYTELRSRPQRRARANDPLATWCEAKVPGVCLGRASHRHHKLRRSQGGGDEASNTADLCSACHGYVHVNTGWAYEAGWLVRAGGAA